MLNYYDFVREEENKARRLTTLQNVNKTRNESDGINPSRVSHACSRSPSPSLCRSLLGTLSRLVLSEFAWPLGSVFCLLFFIDFLKGTQNANNNNNDDEQRQQQQQDEHYGHIIGHYYSVSFYY